MARLVTAETGLLAHLNPGVMTRDELRMLRPTAPSMGMMLETTSRRLFEEPGQVHYGSPDKDPTLRLAVIDDAGRARMPFTTGILVGIGETAARPRRVARRDPRRRTSGTAHVQEVIVQNFRAKPRTAMQDAPDASVLEYVAAVAVARLVLGPRMRIQVPPNLSDPAEFELLVRAGADDWGGVSPLTADHVNPERPWPHLDDLAARTAELGFELRERLTAHPEYVAGRRDVDRPGAARPPSRRSPTPRRGSPHPVRSAARSRPSHVRTDDRMRRRPTGRSTLGGRVPDELATRSVTELAERAAADPLSLDDAEWVRLLRATGADLDALTATADDVRRYTVGEAVSLVVNRNLTSTGLPVDPDRRARHVHARRRRGDRRRRRRPRRDRALRAGPARRRPKTPRGVPRHRPRDQGRDARRAPARLPAAGRRDLADRGGLGLDGALAALRDAGVDTVPGTGVKVLSERVRAARRARRPRDRPVDRGDHRRAPRRVPLDVACSSTATSRRPRSASRTCARCAAIQDRDARIHRVRADPAAGSSGGAHSWPAAPDSTSTARWSPSSRLMLSGSIPHIQIPWTRVGRDAAAILLQSGGDDLGGTLLDGRVLPEAGIEHGLELPVDGCRAHRRATVPALPPAHDRLPRAAPR